MAIAVIWPACSLGGCFTDPTARLLYHHSPGDRFREVMRQFDMVFVSHRTFEHALAVDQKVAKNGALGSKAFRLRLRK